MLFRWGTVLAPSVRLALTLVLFVGSLTACAADEGDEDSVDTTFDVLDALDALPLADGVDDPGQDSLTPGPDAPENIDGASVDASPELPWVCEAPQIDPGLSPISGYPVDGWDWTERRQLLDASAEANYGEGWLDPAPLVVDGVVHVYLTSKDDAGLSLWHGLLGEEGITDVKPVMGIEGGYASALYEDGVFRLWYGGGAIRLAESSDGITFHDVPDATLQPTWGPDFDAMSVLYPSVARVGAGYVLWYTGFDGERMAIGRAHSPDGRAWTRAPTTPVLTQGAATAFDNEAVTQPHVMVSDSGLLMWYGGYDISQTDPGPYRIGLARSDDGVAWEPIGITLELAPAGAEAYSTRDPAVFRSVDSYGWRMLYTAMGDDGRYRIFSARSRTCWP
jgi:predicted GH43/DUF377 family glycosyl hydrolase